MNNCIPANTPGLIAQYDFEETPLSTSFIDNSGNNLNGMYSNMTYFDWPFGSSCASLSNNNPIATTTLDLLKVYPNPTNGIVNLEIKEDVTIEIFDIVGKSIYKQKVEIGLNQIDVSSYFSGVYLLKAINEKGAIENLKIVKNKINFKKRLSKKYCSASFYIKNTLSEIAIHKFHRYGKPSRKTIQCL
ncbi:MAG: T9SS type A sorting domain-containing protein [Flavobacterium sp.]|nr:T9SS type A sorting domain-containing protein [Flavobacterium sp.]